ncbi:Uncharacterised protein [Pseudomonas aeruginosa]|nr:Uncharacterised protein [Pseudomonas aeruginosa]
MIDQLEAALADDFLLALLDFRIHELDHLAGIDADHVVVVAAIGELEHGMAAIEVVTHHQAGGLELGQHPIDGCQAHVLACFHQRLVHVFGAHVALLGRVEHLQDLDPRQGHFKAGFSKFAIFNHVCFLSAGCFAVSRNTGMIGLLFAQPR